MRLVTLISSLVNSTWSEGTGVPLAALAFLSSLGGGASFFGSALMGFLPCGRVLWFRL